VLQIRFRTFDTGFICASAIGYHISNPILEADTPESFIFRHVVMDDRRVAHRCVSYDRPEELKTEKVGSQNPNGDV
jgi:16S rRNA A1518/A1519 N6-dimethyltransferase RsmA/KsgA/DIM1 with predicted DNA glycosylase/AP lyase activity